MKPIHKFNNGNGATLCHVCRIIINGQGINDNLLCPSCQERVVYLLRLTQGIKSSIPELKKEINTLLNNIDCD